MLTEIYIEALLANEEAADAVWEAWDAGEVSAYWAARMWLTIVKKQLSLSTGQD